jgi:cullin 3
MTSPNRGNFSQFSFANVSLSQSSALEIWQSLRVAIEEIHAGNTSKLRYEELYRNAYTLVLHKHGDILYSGVQECISNKLQSTAAELLKCSNDNLIESLVEAFNHHKITMSMIRDILMYLDKTYSKQHKLVVIYEMGLYLFRDQIIRHPQLNPKIKAILLDWVYRERIGEVVDRVLMKNCLSMLVDCNGNHNNQPLEVYEKDFEKDFLLQTRQFYQSEASNFISENTVPDYLRKIEQRIREEENRADSYLDKSTKSKLRVAIVEELINKYAQRLVDDSRTGCVAMFQNNQIEDLNRMYTLFSLFTREQKCLDYIRDSMSKLVKKTGTDIVSDKENIKNPNLFVQSVLDCRLKYQTIVEQSFKNDRVFSRCLKESLEYFINFDSRAAQFLSLYIDDMLKKKLKAISDSDVEVKLNQVISIFRYLQDKDIFEDFYKQHLAARLLTGTSINTEIEKLMIGKLKAECGHQFTSRLEGMFKDMELSQNLMKKYSNEQTVKSNALPATELQVTILTTGFWPLPTSPDIILPTEAKGAIEHFQRFYTTIHSGRRLAWQSNLGSAELRCQFDGGKKELIVHTYQMCILMLFNQGTVYSYAEIAKLTNIPELELSRHLLSLAHPQVKILKKNPNTKAIAPDHKFMYNKQYTSKLYRNKIPLLSKAAAGLAPASGGNDALINNSEVETTSSSAADANVPAAVLEARKNGVEAAIVRIMKSRKTLEHNNLMAEVVKQLSSKFPTEPSFIKKRIESLIEREYIERDKENRRIYHYLA